MIALRNVTKKFKLYKRPSDRLLEWINLGPRHMPFYALRDINLTVPSGRTVGIVGQNGAGKSTLLKLITGTLLPSTGSIELDGRVAALLELGTGFHEEFTGRQNIYMNGQLLGLSHEELEKLEPEIIGFSELGSFIDQPIRTYSSGMILRLGFSIAAAVDPDVLIVDEALSVGDARFSQKCIRRIREFRDQGTTILFVSHDPGAVTTLCDEAILLERGEVRSRGVPKDILDEYKALLAAQGAGNVAMKITRTSTSKDARRRHGTFQALVTRLEVRNAQGHPSEVFYTNDEMRLLVRVDFLTEVHSPTLGFLIKDRLGTEVFGTNTSLQQVELGSYKAGEFAEFDIRIPLPIGYGDYSVTVAIHEEETHLESCYEWTDNAALFSIRQPGKESWYGVVRMYPEFSLERGRTDPKALEEALELRFGDLPDPMPAEDLSPSPFFAGLGLPETKDEGIGRQLSRNARFLFRPRSETVAVRLSSEQEVPLTFELSASSAEEPARAKLDQQSGKVFFKIPSTLKDRLTIFDLTMSTEEQEGPKVWLHEITSVEESQENG